MKLITNQNGNQFADREPENQEIRQTNDAESQRELEKTRLFKPVRPVGDEYREAPQESEALQEEPAIIADIPKPAAAQPRPATTQQRPAGVRRRPQGQQRRPARPAQPLSQEPQEVTAAPAQPRPQNQAARPAPEKPQKPVRPQPKPAPAEAVFVKAEPQPVPQRQAPQKPAAPQREASPAEAEVPVVVAAGEDAEQKGSVFGKMKDKVRDMMGDREDAPPVAEKRKQKMKKYPLGGRYAPDPTFDEKIEERLSKKKRSAIIIPIAIVGVILLGVFGVLAFNFFSTVNLDAVRNTHVHETTDHSITLSWDQVDKAAGYHVFQKKDDSDNYLQIATTEDLYYIVYDLEQATPYSFYVKAFNGNNESQDFTPLENVWTLPQKEEITQISSKSSGVIHLEWTPNSKADGYLVEFHTVGKPYRDENKNVIESGDITSFDITELIPQVNIGVRVTAYFNRDGEQVMGTPSEEKTVRVSGIAAQPADSGSSDSSDSGSTEESSESSESSESGDGDTEQPNDWSDYGDYGDGDYNYVDQGDYYTDEYNYY